MTIVDVEQLGGAITEQLASLFDEEPRAVTRAVADLLKAPQAAFATAAGPTASRRVRDLMR